MAMQASRHLPPVGRVGAVVLRWTLYLLATFVLLWLFPD